MFQWLSKEARLERAFARKRTEAEKSLARFGDRALYARLIAEADEIASELDALRAARDAASST